MTDQVLVSAGSQSLPAHRSLISPPVRVAVQPSNEQLVDAAARVLAVNPAASMTEVARAVGVSRATLHRSFAGRDRLVYAIVDYACRTAADLFDEVVLDRGPADGVLRRLTDRMVPHAHLWQVILQEPLIDTDPALAAASTRLEGRLLELMRRGQNEGVLRTDQPARWMVYLFGVALSAAFSGVAAGFIASREAPELVASSVLDGVRRRAPSPAFPPV